MNLLLLLTACPGAARKPAPDGRIPPGQNVIADFPNLYYSHIPELNRHNWTLTLTGAVKDTVVLDWSAFSRLDTVTVVSDFHCVTGWSRLDNRWTGVRLRDVIRLASPLESARFITFAAADGYTTFLPIEACTGDRDLLAFRWEGHDLETENGGPVRVIVPSKYGYKSAKWLTEMRFTSGPETGTWESKGYSNTADPWKNDRYRSKNDTIIHHR
ncbi:molybdopterin-dependent oxidoreductase [bacterium]|nr:molybdopterin-dependent oxidoreductase [bacterium]